MGHWRSARSLGYGEAVSSAKPNVTQCMLAAATVAPIVLLMAPIVLLMAIMPLALILPSLSIVLITAAGIVALYGWLTKASRNSNGITSWDISGACAFLGFSAGMLCEAEHVLQLFGLAATIR